MKDSDSSTERFDFENFRERIARRKLLLGAVALVSGSILIPQSDTNQDDTNRLSQAESRFVEVAGLVNDADLVDPRESIHIYDEISNSVEAVTDILDHDVPDEPQIEQRVAALSAATEYYRALAKVLDTAATVLIQVADSESVVLNHEGEIGYEPVAEFDTQAFETSITQLSKAEKNSDTVTSRDRKLIPELQQVIDELHSLSKVFESHLTAQQTYIDTATAIEAAVRAYEKSQFDTARSALTDASESLSSGIPEMNVRYRLFSTGLSLDQYVTLLRLRQKGVSKLLSVCDDSLPVQQRRSAANIALDRFFEARRVVIN